MGRKRADIVRVAFNAGIWAPKMDARVDLEKAQFAAREMRNMTCFNHGGSRRRPGLRYAVTTTEVTGPYFELPDGALFLLPTGGLLKLPT